jgi:hypothetical protein
MSQRTICSKLDARLAAPLTCRTLWHPESELHSQCCRSAAMLAHLLNNLAMLVTNPSTENAVSTPTLCWYKQVLVNTGRSHPRPNEVCVPQHVTEF